MLDLSGLHQETLNPEQASLMPDMCHDLCASAGTYAVYEPFVWVSVEGWAKAWYLCARGHMWNCGWSVGQTSGSDPTNIARVVRGEA